MRNNSEFRPRRLYRDTRRKAVAGVFAGVADYFGFSVCFTRIFGLFAMLMFAPVGLIAYVIAAIVLQPMPDDAYEPPVKERFVRSIRRSPEETYSDVSYRFRNIDIRLQKMEQYVTSSRYDLDREFEELSKN